MKRPMVFVFVYLAVGILLGRYWADALYPLLFSAGMIGVITLFLCFRWKKTTPLLFLLFLWLGFVTVGNCMKEIPGLSDVAANKTEVLAEGVVTDVSSAEQERQVIALKCRKIVANGKNYEYTGKINVIMPEGQSVRLWDMVSLQGPLLKLEKNTIPGAYNEWLYLKTRGFDFKMFPEMVEVRRNEPVFFVSGIRKLREEMQAVYKKVFPPEQRGVIIAITTGDKDYIEDQTSVIYEQAGITHILAISGMHVSALALVFFWLAERLPGMSRRYAAVLTIIFLILFALFTGFAASTVRAVIMVSVGMIGIFLYHPGDSINNIAVAGVSILLIQPLYLFDIGFQMSFTTVTSILFCVNVLKPYDYLPNWIKLICVSFMASVSSYPIIAYYFHWVSLVSLLVNMVVLPLMTLLLGVAFATGSIGLFCIPAAEFIGGTAYCILKFIQWASVTAAQIPNSFVCIGAPPIVSIFLWYGCVISIYCYRPNRRLVKVAMGILPVLLILSLVGNRLFWKYNKLAFLDVGQGDAIVLTTYDKKAYVFDTGGWFWTEDGEDNTGGRILLPYLQREGIREIEGLFLSHMDSDHAGGAPYLMEHMDVKGLYLSDYAFEPGLLYAQILVEAKNRKIPLYRVKEGDKAELGENITLTCLYPPKEGGYLFGDDNNGSMVLRLDIGELSVLLTGDASIEDEDIIIRSGLPVEADILKAGHHGSKYSTSARFLEAVQPSIAILSVGESNTYQHPHPEVITRLEEAGVAILRTDKNGTVTILTNGENWTVHKMLEVEYEGIEKAN